MIHSVLICLTSFHAHRRTALTLLAVNNAGLSRLTKFYSPFQGSTQQLLRKIFSLVCSRPAGLCNFLDAPDLTEMLGNKEDGQEVRVVYRNYATLYFVFVVDGAESELGILDLIQVRYMYRMGAILS
jgi:AP-3 complex subunit sigma